jgi:AcrR family transcriptional regulator
MYAARRRLLIEQGRWDPQLTDAGPARDHVQALIAAKISISQIASRAGVNPGTIHRLLHGRRDRGVALPPTVSIRPAVAAAILAVTPDPDGTVGGGLVPPVASARRVQALACRGWPLSWVAARVPARPHVLRPIRDGARTWVQADTAAAIHRVYLQLRYTDPPQPTLRARRDVATARRHAALNGWLPAAVWEDADIGDPAARPAVAAERPRTAAELAAEAEFLMSWGATQGAAAAQLGVSLDTLQQAIRRTARKVAS